MAFYYFTTIAKKTLAAGSGGDIGWATTGHGVRLLRVLDAAHVAVAPWVERALIKHTLLVSFVFAKHRICFFTIKQIIFFIKKQSYCLSY